MGFVGQHGGRIITQDDLRMELARLEEKFFLRMEFLDEKLLDAEEKIFLLHRQVEDQATILHSLRDDAGTTRVDIENKFDMLESNVTRHIEGLTDDIEQKIRELCGLLGSAGQPEDIHDEIKKLDNLRAKVENIDKQHQMLLKNNDSAAKRQAMQLMQSVDRYLVLVCFQAWSQKRSENLTLRRKMGRIMADSLGNAYAVWVKVLEETKSEKNLQGLRKEFLSYLDDVDLKWRRDFLEAAEDLQTRCNEQIEIVVSKMDEKFSEIDEAVGRVRIEIRSEADKQAESTVELQQAMQRVRHEMLNETDRNSEVTDELRQVVSSLQKDHLEVAVQHGQLREQFETVMGRPAAGTSHDGFGSHHLNADPAEFIAEVMRLKAGGNM